MFLRGEDIAASFSEPPAGFYSVSRCCAAAEIGYFFWAAKQTKTERKSEGKSTVIWIVVHSVAKEYLYISPIKTQLYYLMRTHTNQ